MLLVINVGNSNIRFATFFKGNFTSTWTLFTNRSYSAYEYSHSVVQMLRERGVSLSEVKDVVIASVVPEITPIIHKGLTHLFHKEPMIVNSQSKSPLYNHEGKSLRKQLGSDLMANAVSAHSLYEGKDNLVVDFGTALTMIRVSKEGEVSGVLIAPGMNTALKSLVSSTSQLITVEISSTENILNNDTASCIQSGIYHGYLSMVEGLIDKINNEKNCEHNIIATGGLSHIYKDATDKFHEIDRLHTIKGIALLYEMNL